MQRTKHVNNNRIWEVGQKWLLIAGAVIVTFSIFRNASLLLRSQNELSTAQEKLNSSEQEFKKLEQTVSQMSSDVFQESMVRDKLGLAKEGEQVIFLPDDETLISLSPRRKAPSVETLPDPNWRKWAKLFL